MKRKIVCVGNLVLDEVFQVASLPASGIKTGVLGYEKRYGGPAATAAVAICRLGGAAAYWGRVANDAAGEAGIAALSGHGVDCSGVAVLSEGRTLRAIVMVDNHGERSIVSDRHGLSLDGSVLPNDPLDAAGAVLVDSRWPAGALIALDRARAAGVVTVLDADGGAADDNQALIDRADHVVFSSEGLRDHAGEGSAAEQLRHCAGAGGKIVAVTRGSAGSLWLIDGEIVAVPAFKVAVADTTGCGDTFHGAYALALSEGRPPLAAARFASAAAAVKAQRGRGWDGMGDRAAIETMLATGAVHPH
jgi:sulfofructose kinase